MALKRPYLDFIESSIEHAFGTQSSGLRMMELGDQIVLDPETDADTGKAYFTNRGYHHVSVDINGLHGSVVRDLSRPEQFQDWHGAWDIITNAGTSEHVEPFESQYECFRIIHDCLKVGGIAVHLIPDVHQHDKHGAWKNHCRFYYSDTFFEWLAKECGYEVLFNTVIDGLRCATVRKTSHVPFMNDRATFLAAIAQREYSIDLYARVLFSWMGLGRLLRRLGLT